MDNKLPDIQNFIGDEITEGDFKVALTGLHGYLTEAVGADGENITAEVSVSTTGSGNAVTDVTASGSAITVTKGESYVPTSRTINGKALSSNITLNSSNISGFVKTDNGSLAVGSYAFVVRKGSNYADLPTISNGQALAGSSLIIVSSSSSGEWASSGTSPSGTWRNVSGRSSQRIYDANVGLGTYYQSIGCFLVQRIS